LAPFHDRTFTVLWAATVISNIGTWMQGGAASWLMTGLDPSPVAVSLVQVASSLPMFMFALPAGALADVVDRRRLLILIQITVTVLVAVFGLAIYLSLVTPTTLLAFTFASSAAAALIMPAWQAIVPQLVPRQHLQSAVALNSVGLNVSRAVGPALAGLIISALGIAAPFRVNALTTVAVITALIWWRPLKNGTEGHLPAERFIQAISAGLRHARYNSHLRATLIRAGGFFVFASAYWALLPLVARDQIVGGAKLYGVLLGAIGAGAVVGAFALPWLKRRLGPDRTVALGTAGTIIALVLFALARHWTVALCGSLIAGGSWIGSRDHKRFSAAGIAGMGARAWVVDFRHRDVRFADDRERDLGQGRPARRATGSSHPREHWSVDRGPAAVALEAPDRRASRPHAFHALAGSCPNQRRRRRRRTSACDRRVSDQADRSRPFSRLS
jgi:MFS family permease